MQCDILEKKGPGLSLLGGVKLQLEIRGGRKHLELALAIRAQDTGIRSWHEHWKQNNIRERRYRWSWQQSEAMRSALSN